MIKIGITGSLASGKSTASKILSFKGPLFNADVAVKQLYSKSFFKKIISRKFDIKNDKNQKSILKKKILKDVRILKKLEKIIHPLVRLEMKKFTKNNNKYKLVFFEIPLLIESKLMKQFDVIIFIKAKRKIRIKRFIQKGGDKRLFETLNNKQMSDIKKIKFCDHVVVNEKNKKILKVNLMNILGKYE
tara:strand:- start:626 stop:1189 length:564 start_codon:yes stop_codon:yes gene_type:complete